MNSERLMALRVQVAAVLATIDAELAAEKATQGPIRASEDDADKPIETFRSRMVDEPLCKRCEDPVDLCCCIEGPLTDD